MLDESNLLSSYLSKRQNFYEQLREIQQKYWAWFQERINNIDEENELLREYVDCNLDLSTRAPKLCYNPDLDSDILEECSDAFCVAFNLSY